MKSIWTTIGIAAVILFIVCWQFGFFHSQVKDVSTKIDRATAVSRANAMIDKTQRQADELQKKSHELRVKAQEMEQKVERDSEELAKIEFAIKQLAQTLKTAGLPKPSEMGTLTDEQKQSKIVFAGREGTAMDAYNQIGKWNSEYIQKKSVLDAKRNLIAKQNERADMMLSKQKDLYAVIDKIKIQLANLEAEREIAAIDAELAELGATVEGVNMGEIGNVLDTIQGEIDELNAKTDVANAEAGKPTNGDVFVMPEISSSSDNANSLDSFWD